MAEADQDDDAASALCRSLAEMADEDDVRREGAAELPEDIRRLVATAPPEIWPIVSPDRDRRDAGQQLNRNVLDFTDRSGVIPQLTVRFEVRW